MQVERFRGWCQRERVELWALDGDDTIWETAPVFRRFMGETYDYLEVVAPFLSRDEWKAKIEKVNDELFETHGVNPRRWEGVMAKVAAETGLAAENRDEGLRILMQIYQTPLRFLDGSEETLAFLKETKVPVGVITHANVGWTVQKIRGLGVEQYIPLRDVYIVNEDGHKTDDSWREGIRCLGGRPDLSVVVGDSPRSDILPALRIGVRRCFLIDNPLIPRWSIHDLPVDDGVVKIPNLRALMSLE